MYIYCDLNQQQNKHYDDMSSKKKVDGNQRAINKLRAMSGGSRARSERDSGFSDASSEHTSTAAYTIVSEDVTPGRVPLHGAKQGSAVSQLAVVGGSPSYPNMIIMNNVLLKQPSDSPKPLKPWGFSPAVEVVQNPQVVFLQPVVSRPTAPSPTKDTASSRQRCPPRRYLPILKSYPKIAPHPGDISSATSTSSSSSSSSSGRGTASSSSSSSISSLSSSLRSKRAKKLSSGHREHAHRDKRHHHHHHHHHHRNQNKKKKSQSECPSSTSGTPTAAAAAAGVPVFPCAPPSLKPPLLLPPVAVAKREIGAIEGLATSERLASPLASAATSPAIAPSTAEFRPQSQTPTPVAPTSRCPGHDPNPDPNPDPETKRMRFCNTYNILSKSGLLDITLRTKELLRLNQRTQSQLDRLKEHAELLVQAWQSGDPDAARALQAHLREDDAQGEGAMVQETIEV